MSIELVFYRYDKKTKSLISKEDYFTSNREEFNILTGLESIEYYEYNNQLYLKIPTIDLINFSISLKEDIDNILKQDILNLDLIGIGNKLQQDLKNMLNKIDISNNNLEFLRYYLQIIDPNNYDLEDPNILTLKNVYDNLKNKEALYEDNLEALINISNYQLLFLNNYDINNFPYYYIECIY